MMKKIAYLLVAVMLLSIPTVGLADESAPAEGVVVTTETKTLPETETTGEAEKTAENAEAAEVPVAGITPDSWLYGLDNFMKELRLLITFDTAEKAGLLDEISGERLAEAREMIEANKVKYGLIAMKAYKAALEKTIEVLDDAILNEKDIESVLDRFTSNQIEREKLAAIILEEIPEELRAQIEQQLQDAADELEVTIDVTDYDTEDTDTEETSSDDTDTVETEEEQEEQVEQENETPGDTEEETDEDSSEEDTEDADKDETEENEVPVLPLKKQVTVEVLKETVSEAAAEMFAKGELNLRQIITVSSLAEQTGKSFDDVLALFLENEKGIGATAKALELHPKHALKGIKGVFKNAKKQIKAGFAEAKNELRTGKINEDRDEAEDTEKDESEDTEQETNETDTQIPVIGDSEDDSSEQAEKPTVENEEEIKQLVSKHSKKDKTSDSGKDDKKNAKSSNDDDDDDDADEGGSRKNYKDNKVKKEKKEKKEKTNQSDNRSDRAKERSNRKQN